jgi:transcriptional regulator with XRE-family HTH domain
MNVGELIKKYRKLRKMTQKELAEKTNIALMSIQRYERNERQPTIDIIMNISSALDIPFAKILNSTETLTNKLVRTLNSKILNTSHLEIMLPSIAGPIDIDVDVLTDCYKNKKELPESELIKMIEYYFKVASPYEIINFVYNDLDDFVDKSSRIYEIFKEKEELSEILVSSNSKLTIFLNDITEKLNEYFKLSSNNYSILDKIMDLVDYEVYKLKNKGDD